MKIFTLLLSQLFFLALFFVNRQKIIIFLIGLIAGVISITTGIWPLYILIYILYLILCNKIYRYLLFPFALGFFLSSIKWILITKSYFGKICYSNLNFYPYVEGWSKMMVDKGLPKLIIFGAQ